MANDNGLRTYMYSCNLDMLPDHLKLDVLQNTLDTRLPRGTQYAYIVHDEDVYTEENQAEDPSHVAGTPKTHHLHISIYLPNTKTVSAMAKALGVAENTIQKFKDRPNRRGTGKQNLFSYLIHATEGSQADGKHQYQYEQVVTNFDYKAFVEGVRCAIAAKQHDKNTIREKILSGDLRMVDFIMDNALSAFYLDNKNFVINCIDTKYKREMNRADKKKVEVIYVQGDPGSGKSTFARRYALRKYKDYCVSSSKNDSVQDYLGQEVMIFDDARPNDFDASEWLKMLDPYNNQSTVTSRYYNKYLAVKCIILTTTTPFHKFFVYAKNKGGEVDEPVGQFMRRFSYVINVKGYEKADIRFARINVHRVVRLQEPVTERVECKHIKYYWGVTKSPIKTSDMQISEIHERIESDLNYFEI